MAPGFSLSRGAAARNRRAAQELFAPASAAARRAATPRGAPRRRRRRSVNCSSSTWPGCAAAGAFGRAQNLDAADVGELEPGAGKRRQPAAMVVDLLPRLRPVDARLRFFDLAGIGDAGLRLRRQLQRAAFQRGERDAPSAWRRAAPAYRAVRRQSRRRPSARAPPWRSGRYRALPPSSSPSRRSRGRPP